MASCESGPFPVTVHPFESPTPCTCAYEMGSPSSRNALVFIGGLGDGPHTVPYIRTVAHRLGAAAGLIASIAWTGHAASTPHKLGYVHLAADALHLSASAAWIGGLVPLVLLLAVARRMQAKPRAVLTLDAASRFSLLGIVSVAMLIVSGLINAWILVGSFGGLVVTAYGWILMLKLIVFAIMVGLATVNRFRLTPQLALPPGSEAQCYALRRLTRNSVTEIALGLLVFSIVGVLGTLHPATHLMK